MYQFDYPDTAEKRRAGFRNARGARTGEGGSMSTAIIAATLAVELYLWARMRVADN